MSEVDELSLEGSNGFVGNGLLIDDGQPADRVWTRNEFLGICTLLMNGNAPNDFLLVYSDKTGAPKFSKSKTQLASRRAAWAWDTIVGRAKSDVGLGFYPSNPNGLSSWGAFDFDAHDGGAARARGLAVAAFSLLKKKTTLHLILTTSGSEGWHLFIFAAEAHPIGKWTLFLRQVAQQIGAQIESGICEVFPEDTRPGSHPRGLRAPGTWNPKTGKLGLIVFETVKPLLARIPGSAQQIGRPDVGATPAGARVYTGGKAEWLKQFAITRPATRHTQLAALVWRTYRQVGARVGRWLAEQQHVRAPVPPRATLEEHLNEFDELWSWTHKKWLEDLEPVEHDWLTRLATEVQRDLFRIVHNFARDAASRGCADFPFPIENMADRLGVSTQYVSKLRQQFIGEGIVLTTRPAITNTRAMHCRWGLAAPSQ